MPRQLTITDVRLGNILTCLKPTTVLLNKVHATFGTPFIQAILNITISLITAVQDVKKNKDDCIQLMEKIHGVLSAIVKLHIKSDSGGILPPATLEHIGQFTRDLNKLHTFVTGQQVGNRIKRFFRQNEMNTLLNECRAGIQQAVEVFQVETGHTVSTSIARAQKNSEDMHKELLELISSTLSDDTASDRSPSMYHMGNESKESSYSLSLLPSEPKIFHGRESEMDDVLKILNQDSARLVILGAGGMGKTSLARAVVHRPEIVGKYEHMSFVGCDSATTNTELAALIGDHLGLRPEKDLRKSVVQYFSRSQMISLLVLDNLETAWEPRESRSGVEEFLSLLTDIPHLALLVTMRGAERPAKVQWTHPFLPPLRPLSNDAARQTFLDIADDFHQEEEITQILTLTDNMPLAVDLIAHLVAHEGCATVLSRWQTDKTAVLSVGSDRRSNLDASITISLSSPRIAALPDARELLRLLSILPDGLSDVELLQASLPIQDPLACKAALLGTSLAYRDNKMRLKALVPIREYIQHFHPPSPALVRPLRQHLSLLLKLHDGRAYKMAGAVTQITSNLGNLHHILLNGMHAEHPDVREIIKDTIYLSRFNRNTGRARVLMDKIPAAFPHPSEHELEAEYIVEEIVSISYYPISDPEKLISQGISHFHDINNPDLECRFYSALGHYCIDHKSDPTACMESFNKALVLSRSTGDNSQQGNALANISLLKSRIGDYIGAQVQAREAQVYAILASNPYDEARVMGLQARCSLALGNYADCIRLLHKSRELLNFCGMSGGAVDNHIMTSEAEVHRLKSEYGHACNIHRQILNSMYDKGDTEIHAFALLNIAEIEVIVGEAAGHNLEKATHMLQSIQHLTGLMCCKSILADLNLRDGNTLDARVQLQECLSFMWGKDDQVVSYCLERLADIQRWNDTDFDWSSKWTIVYMVQAHNLNQRLELHKALRFFGDVCIHNGDDYTARNLFIVALDGFTYMDVHRSRGDCMIRLGDLAQKGGDMAQARELWREARPLFERSLQAKDVKEIDNRLTTANVTGAKHGV